MDLPKVFQVMKKEPLTLSVSDIDPTQNTMKKKLWDAFHGEQLNCLNLKDWSIRSLIDCISCLPEMATNAATNSNIKQRFYKCGLLNKNESRFPVITKIVNICRTSIFKVLYNKIIDNFSMLYNKMLEQGWIPKEEFDGLGFMCMEMR